MVANNNHIKENQEPKKILNGNFLNITTTRHGWYKNMR